MFSFRDYLKVITVQTYLLLIILDLERKVPNFHHSIRVHLVDLVSVNKTLSQKVLADF